MGEENELRDGDSAIVSANQVFVDLDGEIVILNLADGIYYGLDEIGAQVWNLIQERKTLREIREVLTRDYEVDPEVCSQEVSALLRDLENRGMVEITHAAAP